MEYLKLMVNFPLIIPIATAGAGGAAGFIALSKYRQANKNFRQILLALIILCNGICINPEHWTAAF